MLPPQTPYSRTRKLQQLYELAGTQAGYFTAVQARALGYSPRSLVHHVAAGHFERVSRGYYRLAGFPAGPHEDVVAAWLKLAHRHAVVSHDTALVLHDLAPSRAREIHLTLPRQHRPRTPQAAKGLTLHTTTVPLRRDEITTRFGVQLTSPTRTIVDVADIGADPSVVMDAIARAIDTGLGSPNELRAAAEGRSIRVRRLIDRAVKEAGS